MITAFFLCPSSQVCDEMEAVGGGKNGGKRKGVIPERQKPPIHPLRATTSNALTQNPKPTVEEKGRSQ